MYLWIILGILAASGIAALIIYLLQDKPHSPTKKVDQVAFDQLNWQCGGVNGKNAKLSDVRISNLVVSKPNNMTLKWDVGMEVWGYPKASANGIACLFCKVNDKWIGGKFEWISTSRTFRDFKNIKDSYTGWKPAYLNVSEFAFVVLNAGGSQRSNVIHFKV